MLDLLVAMMPAVFALMIFLLQETAGVSIRAPLPGEVLRGTVTIFGNTDVPGFALAEISFGYADDPTATWFLISSQDTAVSQSRLVEWDTGSITDGDYDLRLRVMLQDGTISEAMAAGLEIKNDVPAATASPAPVLERAPSAVSASAGVPSPESQPTLASTALPTPAPVSGPPRNPAELSATQLIASLRGSAVVILVLFALFGLWLRLRR